MDGLMEGRMNELENLEASDNGLTWHLPGQTEENHETSSVGIASIITGIQTKQGV
jgi:hypothetical protein